MSFRYIFQLNQLFALVAKGIEGSKVIIASILVARFYGPEKFGEFSLVLGIVAIVGILAEFRLSSIVIKYVSKNELPHGEILASALAASSVFAFIGYALIVMMAFGIFDANIASGLIVFSLIYFYKIPRSFRSYFIGIQVNKVVMLSEVLSSLVSISLLGYFILESYSINYIYFARSIDFLVLSISLISIFVATNIKSFFKVNIDFSIKMVREAFPLVVSGMAILLFQKIDLLFIKYYFGDEQNGFYSSATNFMMLFSLPVMVLSESIAPKLYSKIKPLSKIDYLKMITKVGIALSVVMFLLSPYVIPLLFGSEYINSVPSALILSFCPMFLAMGASSGQLIIMEDKQKYVVFKSLIALFVNISLNFVLVPSMGITGAALSSIIAFSIAYFFSHLLFKEYRAIFFLQVRALF